MTFWYVVWAASTSYGVAGPFALSVEAEAVARTQDASVVVQAENSLDALAEARKVIGKGAN